MILVVADRCGLSDESFTAIQASASRLSMRAALVCASASRTRNERRFRLQKPLRFFTCYQSHGSCWPALTSAPSHKSDTYRPTAMPPVFDGERQL
jgi:hypothetical protein